MRIPLLDLGIVRLHTFLLGRARCFIGCAFFLVDTPPGCIGLRRVRMRRLGLLEPGQQVLLHMCRMLPGIEHEVDGQFSSVRVLEKIALQGMFPQTLRLLDRRPHLAFAEAKPGIDVAKAVQNRGVTSDLSLTPDDSDQHDTHEE